MRPERLYYLVTILSSSAIGLSLSTYGLFLESVGLTKQDILLVNAGFFAIIMVLEIPTGAMADRLSRAGCVRAGYAFRALGFAIYAFATNFTEVLLAEVVCGIGYTLVSGAMSSWVFDAIGATQDEGRYTRLMFRGAAVTGVCFLLFGVIGSWFARTLGYQAMLCTASLLNIATCIVTCRRMNGDGEVPHHERLEVIEAIRIAVRGFRTAPAIRWGIMSAFCYALCMPYNYFWQFFYRGFVSPDSMELVWIPICIGFFGPGLYFGSGRRPFTARDTTILGLSSTAAGLTLATLACATSLGAALAVTACHELSRGVFTTYEGIFFQKQFESRTRALSASIQELVGSSSVTLILVFTWICIRTDAPSDGLVRTTWMACGSMLFLSSLALLALRPKT